MFFLATFKIYFYFRATLILKLLLKTQQFLEVSFKMHAHMTAVTIKSNTVVSSEIKDK